MTVFEHVVVLTIEADCEVIAVMVDADELLGPLPQALKSASPEMKINALIPEIKARLMP